MIVYFLHISRTRGGASILNAAKVVCPGVTCRGNFPDRLAVRSMLGGLASQTPVSGFDGVNPYLA